MVGNNVENYITGNEERFSFEEIAYTTMNNVMLTTLTSVVTRNSNYGKANEIVRKTTKDTKISLLDVMAGVFPSFIGGIRNSKPFSSFSKGAHAWR